MRLTTAVARAATVFMVIPMTLTSSPKAQPPVAPVREVVDEYHGVKVSDPYRYMENTTDPEVMGWIKAQAAHTESVLEKIPGREALKARIQELDAGRPYSIGSIHRQPDGSMFYQKQMASENLAKLYIRNGTDGAEKVLIDPAAMTPPDGGHYAIDLYTPSPDGEHVVYGLAASGSEQVTLYIMETATGKLLPESIDRNENAYTPPQWLPDGSGFFYSRRRLLPAEAPETEIYKQTRTYLHRLGTDPEKDPLVFAMDMWPQVKMEEADFPSVEISLTSQFAIGKIKHGDSREMTLYAAPLEKIDGTENPWTLICTRADSVTAYAVHGEKIYLKTSVGAPRYRIVSTSLITPDFAHADVVVPAGDAVVEEMAAAKDALYVGLMTGGAEQIVRVTHADGAKPMKLVPPDDAAAISISSADEDVDGILATTYSWTKRGAMYAYDPTTNQFAPTNLIPQGKYDNVPGYEAVEVLVPSHDGVMVPLSIIYKTGIKLDGANPTYLTGYGSYGISRSISYDPVRLAWLERGGVYAIAHVRGGGELGREWHLAGQKLTKPNTWKDFIACAEYLIEKGYTSPAKLAGQGGSAGGILIGRSVTERPDLWAAALFDVGSLDAVRMEFTTNGVPNIQEFGTVTKEDEFHALLEMSAYHHVQDGVSYPAVMLAHGINDPRVEPWQSAKMTARLQAATSSGKPILFRVDFQAGHGIGSTKTQSQNATADKWSFILWQMGEKEFQVK